MLATTPPLYTQHTTRFLQRECPHTRDVPQLHPSPSQTEAFPQCAHETALPVSVLGSYAVNALRFSRCPHPLPRRAEPCAAARPNHPNPRRRRHDHHHLRHRRGDRRAARAVPPERLGGHDLHPAAPRPRLRQPPRRHRGPPRRAPPRPHAARDGAARRQRHPLAAAIRRAAAGRVVRDRHALGVHRGDAAARQRRRRAVARRRAVRVADGRGRAGRAAVGSSDAAWHVPASPVLRPVAMRQVPPDSPRDDGVTAMCYCGHTVPACAAGPTLIHQASPLPMASDLQIVCLRLHRRSRGWPDRLGWM